MNQQSHPHQDLHTLPASAMLANQRASSDEAALVQQRFMILATQLIGTYGAKFDGSHQVLINVDGMTSIVLLEPTSQVVRIFTDIGLPHRDDRLSMYEAALHYNLPIGFQAAAIGVHPTSSHLVVTGALPILMRGDLCNKLEQLLELTRECAKDFRVRFPNLPSPAFN